MRRKWRENEFPMRYENDKGKTAGEMIDLVDKRFSKRLEQASHLQNKLKLECCKEMGEDSIGKLAEQIGSETLAMRSYGLT